MRWALSPSSQLGACAWKRWASSHVSGGMPPRQGVHVFSARVSLMYLSPRQFLARKATAGERSSIDLPEHDSEEPMIAETSASMCPRLKKSIACRWANEGARILHL